MPCSTAVVFDVDGLMIDSERLSFRILQRMVAERGCHLGDERYPEIIGLDLIGTMEYIIAQTGIHADPAALNDLYQERFQQAIMTQLEPNPGLPELLQELRRRRIPMGVASNSPAGYVKKVLAAIHTNGAFQAVVGRDQVARGKPAPDLYLRATELLGVSPTDCLAVEDSPVGMQSALAAGMRCVVVNELWADPAFAPATARFADLHALREALEDLLCP